MRIKSRAMQVAAIHESCMPIISPRCARSLHKAACVRAVSRSISSTGKRARHASTKASRRARMAGSAAR